MNEKEEPIDLDIKEVAHELIRAGHVSGGYMLILLQQIRDEIAKIEAKIK